MIITLGDRQIAILGYHKIAPPPEEWWSWYYVPEEVFASQLEDALRQGWHPIGLETLLAGLHDPATLPRRSLLVTFDDGYRSFVDSALTVLQRYGCPGVLFVPTAYIGGRNDWDAGLEPEEPICGWPELQRIRDTHVAVQSHSHAHPAFSQLSLAACAKELEQSRSVLETGLGTTVSTIAYPYGDPGETSAEMDAALEAAGYQAGFLFGGDPVVDERLDVFRLPRVTMGPETDLRSLLA